MEDHAEHPASQAKVAKHDVVSPQWVAGRYLLPDLADAIVMRQEVEQAEEHRGGLLNAQKAVERPFPVEL